MTNNSMLRAVAEDMLRQYAYSDTWSNDYIESERITKEIANVINYILKCWENGTLSLSVTVNMIATLLAGSEVEPEQEA